MIMGARVGTLSFQSLEVTESEIPTHFRRVPFDWLTIALFRVWGRAHIVQAKSLVY